MISFRSIGCARFEATPLRLGTVQHGFQLTRSFPLHRVQNMAVRICRKSDRAVAQALGNDLQVLIRGQQQRGVAVS